MGRALATSLVKLNSSFCRDGFVSSVSRAIAGPEKWSKGPIAPRFAKPDRARQRPFSPKPLVYLALATA